MDRPPTIVERITRLEQRFACIEARQREICRQLGLAADEDVTNAIERFLADAQSEADERE